MDQVEHLDDAVRAQVEVFADQLLDHVVADLAGAERGDRDAGRLGHADGVAHLDFATIGQAGGDHVLGDVTRGVGRSEEHTSELQSLMRISYAVFCLKKKKKK